MENSCRICLEHYNADDVLFRPCLCNDYVHKKCLAVWRETTTNPQNFTHCTVCKAKFATKKIRELNQEDLIKIKKERNYLITVFFIKLFMYTILSVIGWGFIGWIFDFNKTIPTTLQPFSILFQTHVNYFELQYYLLFGVFMLSICVVIYSIGKNLPNYNNRKRKNFFKNLPKQNKLNLGVILLVAIVVVILAVVIVFIYAIKIVFGYIKKYNDILQQKVFEHQGLIEICDRSEAVNYNGM